MNLKENHFDEFLNCVAEIKAYTNDYERHAQTTFEKNRLNLLKSIYTSIFSNSATVLSHKKDHLLNSEITILKNFIQEPVCSFPNAHLWMMSDQKPVGMSSINTSDVLWSDNIYEMGILCFKKIYFDIKVNL